MVKPIEPKKIPNPVTHQFKLEYARQAPGLLFESLLCIVAALFLFFYPMETLQTLTLIFGIGIGLIGIYTALTGLTRKSMWGVLMGAIYAAIGFMFVSNPATSFITLVYIFAALFFIRSFFSIMLAIQMIQMRVGHYIISFVMSLISMALAIFLLFHPSYGAITLVYYIGITLLFNAFNNLYVFFQLRKLSK